MKSNLSFVTMFSPGDCIRVEFQDELSGESEWMWVRVESADGARRTVLGQLDNQPVVSAGELSLGQRIAVSYDNVREHAKARDFREKQRAASEWSIDGGPGSR